MRKKILSLMVLALFVTVFSAIGVLAYIQHKVTIRRFHEQHRAIVKFAVTNLEMGIATGQINSVKKFIGRLKEYPIFSGVLVYDPDMTRIMTIPKGFYLLANEEDILKTGRYTHGDISYEIAELTDSDNEELGKLLIAFTFAPMKNEARRALLYTCAFGVFILLPVMWIIAWRLSWYEKALRKNEMHLLEKNRSLAETRLHLEKAKQEIEHMLNNLDEGIFTINPDCSINTQHSRRARALFGVNDFQGAKLEEIFHADEDSMIVFKKWIDLVREPRFFKKWEMYEKLNPFREINKYSNGSEQVLKVEYIPIIENDSLAKIMVLATDITEKIKSQKELEKSRREQDALIERVVALVSNEKIAVDMFMDDTNRYLEGFYETKSAEDLSINVDQIYRDMHTIKGNAGTFGFGTLARLAGNMEELFVKLKGQNTTVLYHQWCKGLDEFITELVNISNFRKKIFPEDKDTLSISLIQYDRLMQAIKSRKISDINQIHEHLYNLNSKPLESYCNKYQRIIKIYREKYNKKIDDLKIENPEQMVHRDVMHALDPNIIHIIRNAVDHGIESNEERQQANKGPGLITISFESDKNGSTLTVSDNGKGIDADGIVKLAIERNLIRLEDAVKLSKDEKINLIFEPGLTTKKETTEISGRGVGMDAVKTNMEKLNGSVTIETKVGNGTTVMLKLPPMEMFLETKS